MQLTNFTRCGNCSNCGQCCSDLLHLDKTEIEKIDNYLKEHKVKQHNKEANNWNCPFRNEELKKCDIYEVRPLICQRFKCDVKPQDAFKQKDLINNTKKPRSMTELFFKDDSKIELASKYGIKIYKRNEEK